MKIVGNGTEIEISKIGEYLAGEGGHFAGIMAGVDGSPDYLLIVGPEFDGEKKWDAANEWAASLSVDGKSDFTLPNRKEQRLLFANVQGMFQNDWYWSSEQHADDSDYAWLQFFGSGDQSLYRKSYDYRVRAVRRIDLVI